MKKNYRGKLRCQVHPTEYLEDGGREVNRVLRRWFLSLERERNKMGWGVNSDEI